jgi:RNA polymerase sigma factor (sigma-70 family)
MMPKYQYINDEQLLQDLAHEKTEAWEYAYRSFKGNILGFLRNRSCGEEEARDIFHEAMLVLGTKAANLVLRNTRLATWLTQVAKNKFLNALRRTGREVPFEPEILPDLAETSLVDGELWGGVPQPDEQLGRILASLSEKCQQLLTQRHILGLTPLEIAKRNGYTDGHNATVQVSRCMDKAKQLAREQRAKF